jgi:chromosome segregation ATPase
MNMGEMLTPIVVALVGAGGLWTFLSNKSKQAHERLMQDREERGEFNDTLKVQVDRLAEQVNTLVKEKEDLLRQISDLRADLAAAQTTIKHLEELLRSK